MNYIFKSIISDTFMLNIVNNNIMCKVLSLSKFRLKHILGLLTLRSGIILLSTIFITLSVCIFEVNVLSIKGESPLPWTIMLLFITFMVIIWSIALKGAYQESYKLITGASILWTLYLIIWIVSSVWLFIDTRNKIICLESRCLSVLWLFKNSPPNGLKYSENKSIKPQAYKLTLKPPNYTIRPIYERTFERQSEQNMVNYKRIHRNKNRKKTSYLITTEPFNEQLLIEDIKINIKPVLRIERTISIIITFIFLIIMLYSWMILISYQNEIQPQTRLISNV